jgi:hypothetical protein
VPAEKTQTLSAQFTLSWSHYVFLMGIILCRKKHDALVEITLPKDANIHAREYQLYLPDKELLRQKLVEWSEEAERNHG